MFRFGPFEEEKREHFYGNFSEKGQGEHFLLTIFSCITGKRAFQLSLGMSGYRYAVRNQHELVPFATR